MSGREQGNDGAKWQIEFDVLVPFKFPTFNIGYEWDTASDSDLSATLMLTDPPILPIRRK